MAMFRENLSSGMNFLRRRFSSDDIYRDAEEAPPTATGARSGGIGRKNPGAGFPSLSSVQGMIDWLID